VAARVRKAKLVVDPAVGPVKVLEVAVLPSWDLASGLVLWALRVVVPAAAPVPVGAAVELSGLRVEFVTRGGRCRPVVRADGVREVVSGVRAA
jgi:hypothetical protein